MRCAICGTELGHPDAYCPSCWSRDSDRNLWGHSESYQRELDAAYYRYLDERYEEEMREQGATWGCA